MGFIEKFYISSKIKSHNRVKKLKFFLVFNFIGTLIFVGSFLFDKTQLQTLLFVLFSLFISIFLTFTFQFVIKTYRSTIIAKDEKKSFYKYYVLNFLCLVISIVSYNILDFYFHKYTYQIQTSESKYKINPDKGKFTRKNSYILFEDECNKYQYQILPNDLPFGFGNLKLNVNEKRQLVYGDKYYTPLVMMDKLDIQVMVNIKFDYPMVMGGEINIYTYDKELKPAYVQNRTYQLNKNQENQIIFNYKTPKGFKNTANNLKRRFGTKVHLKVVDRSCKNIFNNTEQLNFEDGKNGVALFGDQNIFSEINTNKKYYLIVRFKSEKDEDKSRFVLPITIN